MRNIIFVILLCLWGPFASAANFVPQYMPQPGIAWVNSDNNVPLSEQLLLIAENTQGDGTEQPEPGSLVIPGEESDKADKKCLTVCKKWGEDCIINPRTAGGGIFRHWQ